MAKKPCIVCHQPTRQTRCPNHRIPKPSRQERDRRQRFIAAWTANQGCWCPGWQTPAHPSTDLTADHIHPRSHHGDNGPLQILCRTCNARRSNPGGRSQDPTS